MYKNIKKFFSIFACILILSVTVLPVQADGDNIPASGEICAQGICNSIQITFPPKGGPVSGTLSGQGSKDGCNFDNEGTISGTFAGGDGGQISGTVVWTMTASCGGNSISQTWSGTWQGTLSADGTGSGDGSVSGVGASWTLSFSGADFQRILSPITKEYFKATYGLDVVDGNEVWDEKQLVLLNDVLKILPLEFRKYLSLKTISRDEMEIDQEGKKHSNTTGIYYPTKQTIHIFNKAFANDPTLTNETEIKKIKHLMMHEIAHSLEYYNDGVNNYDEATVVNGDLFKNFYGYTRDNQEEGTGGGWEIIEEKVYIDEGATPTPRPTKEGGGWGGADLEALMNRPYKIVKKWRFNSDKPENQLPTAYAGESPFEDFAETLAMYVSDPQKLKEKSTYRYEFAKVVFENVEFGGF